MKLFFLIIIIFLTGCATKLERPQQIILPAKHTVLITNISKQSIILNRHLKNNPGVSAGWSSRLDPDHQSLLATPSKKFILSCSHIHSFKDLNCSKMLNVRIKGSTTIDGWRWENRPVN